MQFSRRTAPLLGLTALAVLGLVAMPVQAQTKLTSRSQVPGRNVINFSALPDYSTGDSVSNPFTITSTGGTQAVVSQDGGPTARFFGGTEGTSIAANFAPGDPLLGTGQIFTGEGGPITFTFVNGLSALGTQIASDDYGEFIAQIQTFDRSGNLLSTFTENGVTNGNNDNSAIFLGVADPTADIYQATFSLTTNSDGTPNDFFINRVSLAGAPVPEASTTVSLGLLLTLGTSGVAVTARRKKATA